jgi:hypothetical protein
MKQSSNAIALEYANADPTYVTKTNALAVTHPFTRIMKGDGNCGWRGEQSSFQRFVGRIPYMLNGL